MKRLLIGLIPVLQRSVESPQTTGHSGVSDQETASDHHLLKTAINKINDSQ